MSTEYRDPAHDEELRKAICAWLRDNGIDPGLVPGDEKPDCSYRDNGGVPIGGHTITTRVYVSVSPGSRAHIVRYGANRTEQATITKRMKVPPPLIVQQYLDSRCPTCGQ